MSAAAINDFNKKNLTLVKGWIFSFDPQLDLYQCYCDSNFDVQQKKHRDRRRVYGRSQTNLSLSKLKQNKDKDLLVNYSTSNIN